MRLCYLGFKVAGFRDFGLQNAEVEAKTINPKLYEPEAVIELGCEKPCALTRRANSPHVLRASLTLYRDLVGSLSEDVVFITGPHLRDVVLRVDDGAAKHVEAETSANAFP